MAKKFLSEESRTESTIAGSLLWTSYNPKQFKDLVELIVMYEFITGPLLWASFIVFVVGSVGRIIWMVRLAIKDKVIFPYLSLKYSLRSFTHWIIPFGTTKMRKRPVTALVTFAFHVCAIITPIFLLPHNLLWDQAWSIQIWSLPERLADVLTVVVIGSCLFCLSRRIILPEVKFLTSSSDYLLLMIVLAPFLTGFIAYHQMFSYKEILLAHILAGELMLIAIPFTRLSHIFFFFVTRAYMGSEFGAVRHSRDW
jgi:nitrate reductase gamma subunit